MIRDPELDGVCESVLVQLEARFSRFRFVLIAADLSGQYGMTVTVDSRIGRHQAHHMVAFASQAPELVGPHAKPPDPGVVS